MQLSCLMLGAAAHNSMQQLPKFSIGCNSFRQSGFIIKVTDNHDYLGLHLVTIIMLEHHSLVSQPIPLPCHGQHSIHHQHLEWNNDMRDKTRGEKFTYVMSCILIALEKSYWLVTLWQGAWLLPFHMVWFMGRSEGIDIACRCL